MDIHEIIKTLKSEFRLYMNGIASKTMRESGIGYKINFGIEIPRLKELAAQYPKNHELAQALWLENIRECKILATLLQPTESFTPQLADKWVESCSTQELVDVACLNLFQHLQYAPHKSVQWILKKNKQVKLFGYTLITRMVMLHPDLFAEKLYFIIDQAITDAQHCELPIKKITAKLLKRLVEQDKNITLYISDKLESMLQSTDENARLWATDIKFTIEYFA